MTTNKHSKLSLRLKRLGIDTYKEAVIYLHADSPICKAEGFEAPTRVVVNINNTHSITATLNTITSDILGMKEVSLSEYAWQLLDAKVGDEINLSHPAPLRSLRFIRGKIYGKRFTYRGLKLITSDVIAGRLSDIHLASFLTSCANSNLNRNEITYLTRVMVEGGTKIDWHQKLVVDKHCIGGLPGNRTSPIVVAIVAAYGLTIPKTSSRAITSSAGTADMMEALTTVDLSLEKMRAVVKQEGGCLAWGGSVSLSPADDILIGVERVLNLDSQGQLIASVLSKKIAAGSSHVVIDIPIGNTAKVRSIKEARQIKALFEHVGKKMGLVVKIIFTNGSQPVGYGIGPSLEARDVVDVLQNKDCAPKDLRERALELAGLVLEFSPNVEAGEGKFIATEILNSGQAWHKFVAICKAQGGMKTLKLAPYTKVYSSPKAGKITSIDNRRIAQLAKLAGAPYDETAGVDLHVKIGDEVKLNQPLLTIHAESPGEIDYAWDFLEAEKSMIEIKL